MTSPSERACGVTTRRVRVEEARSRRIAAAGADEQAVLCACEALVVWLRALDADVGTKYAAERVLAETARELVAMGW